MRDDVGLVCVGLALLFMIAILYGHQRRESFANESNVWESIQREVEADLQTFLVFDVGTFRANTADQKKFFALVDGFLSDAQKAEAAKQQEKIDAFNKAPNPNAKDPFNSGIDISWLIITDFNTRVSKFSRQLAELNINIFSPGEYDDPTVKENVGAYRLKPYFKGTFDLDKPFNTRIALLDAEYARTVANNSKGQSGFYDIQPLDAKASEETKSHYEMHTRMFFMMTMPARHLIPGAKSIMYTMAKAYMSSPYIGLLNAKAVAKTGSESVVSGVVSSIFGS
jgi:hypothetical protein